MDEKRVKDIVLQLLEDWLNIVLDCRKNKVSIEEQSIKTMARVQLAINEICKLSTSKIGMEAIEELCEHYDDEHCSKLRCDGCIYTKELMDKLLKMNQ